MMWVYIVGLVAAVLVVSRAHLSAEKRCQSICQLTQLDEQCKMCNARSPVRFGKRSKEIPLTSHSPSMDSRLRSLSSVARLLSEMARLGYTARHK